MRNKRLFIYLAIGFIIATIFGTIAHELGHYSMARLLGFDAGINYRSSFTISTGNERIKTDTERFLITLGGPLQTILTGSVGLLLLSVYRDFFQQETLNARQWLLIFISLFWLRQPVNLLLWLASGSFTGKWSASGDEIKISRYLQLPDWFIITITGLVGAIVVAVVLVKFIPRKQRQVMILSGIIGGISGYLLWFGWLGKLLMP